MGHRGLNNTFDTNMKLFVTLAGLLAAAQAEAFYGYGYGLHQQNWPTAYGPGFERTIWGARGKRDADAFHGYGGLGLGSGGFIRQSRVHPGYGGYAAGGFAHLVGKRSADAFGYGYAPFRALGGAGLHPTGASYSNRSPQGAYGKRDADTDAFGYGYGGLGLGSGGFIRQSRVHPGYGGYAAGGFAHLVGKRSADAYGYGYAPFRALGGAGLHPTGASYSNRSPQGAYGKRDAEAHYGYGYAPLIGRGVAIHPGFATSYTQRSPQGLHKRDADAEALGLGAGGFIRQSRPYAALGIHHNGYGAFAHPVGKRDADAFYAPVLAKGYPSWPGVVAPGFESTFYGCGLGKREAVEEPKALATHPNGGTSFVGETVWGFPVAKAVEKRDADPAVSYSNRSPQGAYGPAPYYWG